MIPLALRDWWQRLFLRAVAPSRDEPEDRTLGRLQMRVAQAHADYQSAKQTWPRDRKAIDRAWRQFRDARCEQISAEIGR